MKHIHGHKYLNINLLTYKFNESDVPPTGTSTGHKRILKLYKIKSKRTILKTSHVRKISVTMAPFKIIYFLSLSL